MNIVHDNVSSSTDGNYEPSSDSISTEEELVEETAED